MRIPSVKLKLTSRVEVLNYDDAVEKMAVIKSVPEQQGKVTAFLKIAHLHPIQFVDVSVGQLAVLNGFANKMTRSTHTFATWLSSKPKQRVDLPNHAAIMRFENVVADHISLNRWLNHVNANTHSAFTRYKNSLAIEDEVKALSNLNDDIEHSSILGKLILKCFEKEFEKQRLEAYDKSKAYDRECYERQKNVYDLQIGILEEKLGCSLESIFETLNDESYGEVDTKTISLIRAVAINLSHLTKHGEFTDTTSENLSKYLNETNKFITFLDNSKKD